MDLFLFPMGLLMIYIMVKIKNYHNEIKERTDEKYLNLEHKLNELDKEIKLLRTGITTFCTCITEFCEEEREVFSDVTSQIRLVNGNIINRFLDISNTLAALNSLKNKRDQKEKDLPIKINITGNEKVKKKKE